MLNQQIWADQSWPPQPNPGSASGFKSIYAILLLICAQHRSEARDYMTYVRCDQLKIALLHIQLKQQCPCGRVRLAFYSDNTSWLMQLCTVVLGRGRITVTIFLSYSRNIRISRIPSVLCYDDVSP